MSTLRVEQSEARAQHVKVTADTLTVDLTDGRTISVPLAWFPRLLHGSVAERSNWRFIARGEGIHWTDLDEDISVEGCCTDNNREKVMRPSKNGFRAVSERSPHATKRLTDGADALRRRAVESPLAAQKTRGLITISPKVMAATPVFAGTLVPVQTLFEYIVSVETIDDFLR